MPQQHRFHAVVTNPIQAEVGVDFGPIVVGKEAIALEPPRCHQDEDAEGGVAEAEALRQILRQEPDQ